MERSQVNKSDLPTVSSVSQSQQQQQQQQLVELKQEIINHDELNNLHDDGGGGGDQQHDQDHTHHNSSNNTTTTTTTTTIICECDGSGNLTQVGEHHHHHHQHQEDHHQDQDQHQHQHQQEVSLQEDQNLDHPTEIRIKVDVDDPSSEESFAQLGHNVTTANIITIPVVPYTVIGDADGNGGQSIQVSLANPDALTHHQLQTHQLQHLQQQQSHHTHHHHQHQSNNQQIHQLITVKTEPGLQNCSASSSTSSSTSSSITTTPIKQQQQHQNNQNSSPITHLTWEEAVNAAVLPIRCKDTNAELYKAKFGSGNKGKCIKSGDQWFTPTEFEALCGRGNSKDWKRSIRFGGRTLQTLIDKGYLVPHASSCICSNCVDDSSATGPIRPFTPYQRKRKNQGGDSSGGGGGVGGVGGTSSSSSHSHSKSSKLERLQSKDSNTDESSDVGTPVTPCGITPSMNPLTAALMKMNQASPPTTEEAWRNLEDMVEKIAQAALLMKQMVKDMKERTTQESESLRSQLVEQQEMSNLQNLAASAQAHHHHQQQQQQQQQQVQVQQVQGQQTQITVDGITRNLIESPQILRIFDSNRIQTYSIEVLDPETFKQLQAAQPNTAKIICQDRTLKRQEITEEEEESQRGSGSSVPTATTTIVNNHQ